MKKKFIFILFLFSFFSAKSQILESRVSILEKRLRKIDSLEYTSLRNSIMICALNGDVLQKDFDSRLEYMKRESFIVKIGASTNPTSSLMGFRFDSLIIREARNVFKSKIGREHDKGRFESILKNVITNPVVTSLLNSNPISALVGQVANTAITFVTATKAGSKIKEIDEAVKKTDLDKFKSNLDGYLKVYEKIETARITYNTSIASLENKYEPLKQNMDGFYNKFILKLGVSATNVILIDHINGLMPSTPSDFSSKLSDSRIQAASEIAKDFPSMRREVESFKNECNTVLLTYLEAYKSAIDSDYLTSNPEVNQTDLAFLRKNVQDFINLHFRSLTPTEVAGLNNGNANFKTINNGQQLKFDLFENDKVEQKILAK